MSPFTFARWAGIGSVMLTGMAMLAYPGGTLRDPSTRGYSFFRRAAGITAVLSSVGLVGAAAAPADRRFSVHVWFGLFAHATAPIAALLLALATARDSRFGAGVAVAWASLTFVPAVLILIHYWKPGVATNSGPVFRATIQKVAAIAYVGLCIYQTYAADRVAARNSH